MNPIHIHEYYPLVIKHGVLENGPLIGDVPSYKPPFLQDFSACHVADYQRVDPYIYHKSHGKPPFSYGSPMVFLWFSYGFPIVFLWFPRMHRG